MREHDPLTDDLRELAELDRPAVDLVAVRRQIEGRLEAGGLSTPRRAASRGRSAGFSRPRRALPLVASATVTVAVIAAAVVATTRHGTDPAGRGPGAVSTTVQAGRTSPRPAVRGQTTIQTDASHPSHALLVREDSHEHHRAPTRLLSAFAVFDPGHLPRTVRGATLSRPPLSALPDSVLQTADPRRRNHIDVDDIRQVRFGSGVEVWILPGTRSLCLVAGQVSQPRRRRGGNEGCGPLAQAISEAAIGGTTARAGAFFTYGIVPKGHRLRMVQVGPVVRPVHPVFGVYGLVVRRHHSG